MTASMIARSILIGSMFQEQRFRVYRLSLLGKLRSASRKFFPFSEHLQLSPPWKRFHNTNRFHATVSNSRAGHRPASPSRVVSRDVNTVGTSLVVRWMCLAISCPWPGPNFSVLRISMSRVPCSSSIGRKGFLRSSASHPGSRSDGCDDFVRSQAISGFH